VFKTLEAEITVPACSMLGMSVKNDCGHFEVTERLIYVVTENCVINKASRCT